MKSAITYKWLEVRPEKRFTKQLYIKGRNMSVWNLVAEIVTQQATIEEVVEDRELPREAIEEALDYYYANRSWIDAETDELGRRLGLK